MTDLGQFEGRDVVAAKLAISKAGDGLSAALEVDPVNLAQGALVQVVLETRVGPITFEPAADGDGVVRKHKLITERATLVPGDSPVGAGTLSLLNETTERLAAAGVSPGAIPGQTTDPALTPGGVPADADADQAVADAIESDVADWEDPAPAGSRS